MENIMVCKMLNELVRDTRMTYDFVWDRLNEQYVAASYAVSVIRRRNLEEILNETDVSEEEVMQMLKEIILSWANLKAQRGGIGWIATPNGVSVGAVGPVKFYHVGLETGENNDIMAYISYLYC